ncbi:YlmH/Sll1252 family protein [Pseudoramibacter sp. HA2172]|uniref:YlmH/Sll1252 family protein n=1 Tax=Pseudoramibacter faecis TaxID=3108534 RepID=UPI002E76BA39|nr:YlmH/Sll1252 family protein [Pseudoramibacter sp. HA2172]
MNNQIEAKKAKKEKIILERVKDAALEPDYLHFFDFYDEMLQMQMTDVLKKSHTDYFWYGGFDDAVRKMLCIIPDYLSETIQKSEALEWPMMAARFPADFEYNHRHVLGELMSLGIERSCIGDIHIGGDETQVIFHEKIYLFLKNNFTRIRGKKIMPSFYPAREIRAYASKFEEKIITVSSPRIDAVIDRIWDISRQSAAEAIYQKRLRINYREISKKELTIKPGDIISFRGKGKAKVSDFVGVSKKGKQRIKIERYI